MAGEKTVGDPDPTGMKHSTNVDRGVLKAKTLGRRFMEYVPGSAARGAMKEAEKTRARLEEEKKAKEAERAETSAEDQRVNPNVDVRNIRGQDLTDFNNLLLDAIRKGKARGSDKDDKSADSVIWRVITHETFISAIANTQIKTPHEELDDDYASKDMARRRRALASTLTSAATKKEFMLGDLTVHELDIIYVTIMGTAEEQASEEPGRLRKWMDERREKRLDKRDEKLRKKGKPIPERKRKAQPDKDVKSLGAVELWKNTAWPADLPRPHEAFLMFLEAVAVRNFPARKGEFIGNVLKDLSARTTFTSSNERPSRNLVDGGYINEYLYSRSSYPIDQAVDKFNGLVTALLNTPTSEMDRTLGVPGIGYSISEDKRRELLAARRKHIADAKGALDSVKAESASAAQAVEAASRTVDSAAEALGQAEQKREAAKKAYDRMLAFTEEAKATGSLSLRGGKTLKAGTPEFDDALSSAESKAKKGIDDAVDEVEAANEALGRARASKETAEDVLRIRNETVSEIEAEVKRREANLLELERIGYEAAASDTRLWVEEARQRVQQQRGILKEAADAAKALETASLALAAADSNVAAANASVANVEGIIRKARAEGSVTLKGGVVLKADAPKLQESLAAATAAVASAREAQARAQSGVRAAEEEVRRTAPNVRTAEAELAKAEKEVGRREDELAKFEREHNPQAFARELSQHFKALLEDNREVGVDLEAVGDRMKERLPNIIVTRLLDKAEAMVGPMEEVAKIFHPEFIIEESLRASAMAEAGAKGAAAKAALEGAAAPKLLPAGPAAAGAAQEPAAARQARQLVTPQQAQAASAAAAIPASVSEAMLTQAQAGAGTLGSGEGAEHAGKLIVLARAMREDAAAQWLLSRVKGPSIRDSEIFVQMKEKFDADMASLGADIESAEVPEEVKQRMRTVHRCMTSLMYPGEMDGNPRAIKSQLREIREEFAYPLKKAGKLAVAGLKEKTFKNLTGISDGDKVVARMTYEARTPEIPSPVGKAVGKWKRFWNWFDDNILTAKAWVGRDTDHPGYLVLGWRKSLGEPVDLLFSRGGGVLGSRQKRVTKRWGTIRRMPNRIRGVWGLAWRGYVAGTMIAGASITTHDWHWYNPFTWVTRPVTLLAERINGGPIYIPNSQDHWYYPWSFVMPLEREREVKRVIHDTYDDPVMLPERGNKYYRDAYGVGTHRVPNETSDNGMSARLAWIQGHPDVLRFLQERTTGRQDVQVTHLRELPENCSTRQQYNPQQHSAPAATAAQGTAPAPVSSAQGTVTGIDAPRWAPVQLPRSCRNLGLGSEEMIRDYSRIPSETLAGPVDRDGWEPSQGLKVCCTIAVSSRAVPDGLRLNTYMSDRFVDTLMAFERGGGRVDYRYLTSRQNMARWVQEWFVIPPNDAGIITNFRIYDKSNVGFLSMQSADATRILLPRCAQEARAPEFLIPANRDAFVTAWREEVVRSQSTLPTPVTIDPLTQDVSADVLQQAFDAVKLAHQDWFTDRTHDYERLQVRDQLSLLNLQTDTAVDILVAQRDIFDMVKQFTVPGSAFLIVPPRSDEFVITLSQCKAGMLGEFANCTLDDFNPFSTTDGSGSRVEWAVNRGYISPRSADLHADESSARGGTADSGTAARAPAQAGPQQPQIPALSQAGERFYARQENDTFNIFVHGVVNMLSEDRGNDGRVMRTALETRFANDPARMERAVKARIYNILTSSSAADLTIRNGWGLTIAGQGDTLAVSVADMGRARGSLRSFVKTFVMGLNASPGAAPPAAR